MTLVNVSQVQSEIDRDSFAEFIRVNDEHKRITGNYLMDIEFMKKIALAKAKPELYDTSLPALRPGVREVIVDIFKGGGMREVMENDPLESYDEPFVVPVHAVADEPSSSPLSDKLPEERELETITNA